MAGDTSNTATNSTKEPSVYKINNEKAVITNEKVMRYVFWADVVLLLANLLFLYRWMFDFGYLPDWSVISRLFFASTLISISQRRLFRSSGRRMSFSIAVSDAGIILEDYYTREVVEKSRLQAIIPPGKSGFIAIRALCLVIDDKLRVLPEHIDDVQLLIDELLARFQLPLVDRSELVKRGWQPSTLKIMLYSFCLVGLVLSMVAVISEFTAGLARVTLLMIVFIAIMLAVHRFLSSVIYLRGAVVKRRNPAIDIAIVPVMIVVALTIFEAVDMAGRDKISKPYRMPATELPKSLLAGIDTPECFKNFLSGEIGGDGLSASFTQAIASWPAEERSAYESMLIKTTADPALIAPQAEPPAAGAIKVELSYRRAAEAGRRHRFFRHLAPISDREEVILAIVRAYCLCAAELEASHAELYPGYAPEIPGFYRRSAASTLRKYLVRGTISRQGAVELLLFVRKLENVLSTPATLLATEDACWSEQLRLFGFEVRIRRSDLSGMAFFPDPDSIELKKLRAALFELPLPVLSRHVAGNATFPAVLADLENCRTSVQQVIEGWGYRIAGVLLLPYQLQNLVTVVDFSYDWGKIWIKNTECRQRMHTLGYVAALAACQNETGSAPASLAELGAWLESSLPSVHPPRDLFAGGSLLYEVASAPRLYSAGPDGKSGSDDDIVLYP